MKNKRLCLYLQSNMWGKTYHTHVTYSKIADSTHTESKVKFKLNFTDIQIFIPIMKPPKINDQSLNRLCGIYFSLLNVVVCLFVLLGDFLAIKITHKKQEL